MKDETYVKMASVAYNKFNDKGFCGVVATATACRISFGKAHNAWKKIGGRRNGQGTQWNIYSNSIFKVFGYKMDRVVDYITYDRPDLNPDGYKMGTTSKVINNPQYQKGVYLIRTRRHIFAMVNGKVNDWNENKKVGQGSRTRVTNIYKVTKLNEEI